MIDVSKLADMVNGKLSASNSESFSKDILKVEIGDTVTGRFVLNPKDPTNTIWPYAWHGWKSTNGSGKSIFVLCPSTYGETCPICQKSIKLWKSNNADDKALSKKINRRRNRMVNFYVIDDSKNPDNNGTVKIFRYGEQIDEKIKDATIGDDKELYGNRIWSLDETGCNFRIKVTPNHDGKDAWPTYVKSSFYPPSKIDGMTPERQEEIFNSAFDLTKQFESKTYKELAALLDEHFSVGLVEDAPVATSARINKEQQYVPATLPDAVTNPPVSKQKVAEPVMNVTNADIDDILNDIQNEKK